ncbi:hypothetical protein [Kineococcus gypseus]|uniref:hypothetical protein n=1 Tax=Kineococcus gypseus TaxID=1637102 RepID=UPI003D7E4CAF
MSGLLTLVPVVLCALAGVVVGAVVLARRAPAGHLSAPVARARRRGAVVALTAALLTAATLLAGLSLPGGGLRGTRLVALAPLAAAGVHALVLLAGELTWPRPRQRVRSAALAVRTARSDAPRGLLALFTAGCALALLTCLAGALLADGSGRALGWTDPAGLAATAAGPFPGAFYAVPVAAGVVVVAALTLALLLRVPARPAVPDAAADAVLRRTAAHRVLRVSTSAVLGTTAALWVVGGAAASNVARGVTYGVDGAWTTVRPGAAWALLGGSALAGGVLLLLAALAVLLVPARGPLRRGAAVPA